MCDAVAVMPVTEILSRTLRAGFTVTVPVPAAEVVTGGTSLLPDKVNCCAWSACIVCDAQAARIPATARAPTRRPLLRMVLMVPPVGWDAIGSTCRTGGFIR